jgi:hypothetical protein
MQQSAFCIAAFFWMREADRGACTQRPGGAGFNCPLKISPKFLLY